LNVASEVRSAMQRSDVQSKLSAKDLEAVKKFLQNPREGASLAQVGNNNPNGDYAPASMQIQGIFKSMLDAVVADLADAKTTEDTAETAFQSLLSQKLQQEAVLASERDLSIATQAEDEQSLANQNTLRDTTKANMEADQEFFKDTKKAAEAKAREWSTRSRLRTEELLGLAGAVTTLSAARDTFGEASLSKKSLEFFQVDSVQTVLSVRHIVSMIADAKLTKSKAALRALGQAMPKEQAQQVISKIDKMVADLRKEEQDDIDQRGDCNDQLQASTNKLADIAVATTKADEALAATVAKINALRDNLGETMRKVAATKKEMKEITHQRGLENVAFKKALEADKLSAETIGTALAVLTKFYKAQGQNVGLVQKTDPSYTRKLAPPKAEMGGDHTGETTGVVAILNMMKEDFEKEMKEASNDEAELNSDYKDSMAALNKMLDSLMDKKGSLEKQLSKQKKTKVKNDNTVTQVADNLAAATALRTQLDLDCAWVMAANTNSAGGFDLRRTQRKSEIDSISNAKDFLGDILSGKPVLPTEER